MATGSEKGVQAAHGPAACYRELSRFPAVTRAALRAAAGGQTFLLYTECSRPDLTRWRLLRFDRHYSLRRTASREGLAVSRTALSAEIHDQYGTGGLRDGTLCLWHGRCLRRAHSGAGAHSAGPAAAAVPPALRLLSQDSPTGQRRAVLKRCPRQGHELLEVWDSGGCSHSVDLTALGKHGDVYTEGPFACLAWSHSETRLLYVAEKSRPKREPPCPWDVPGAAWPAAEDEDEETSMPGATGHGADQIVPQGKQFVYHEDWGEALSTRSEPVLCVLDLEGLSLSVLEGVPEHLSPGQALWSPDDHGVVFVGWWNTPFRLGLNACSNRRSGIFHLDLASGCCELLSAENASVCSPRLSPDGQRLLYLEGVVGGPHRQCLRLLMDLLLVDTEASTVTNLTAGGPHAVFDARWRPSMAALCQLGFAVLLVNYRGSLGFGQASISSLLSRVGEEDVADTQLAVEQALHREPLDPHRLGLLAGSHGAFIALHLITREPERYRACALRSPVSNLPALLGTSDIPDWRYTSLGLPYSFERVPCAEEVATMLLRSPISQAAQVQTPVLLCVGARDRRVSPTQALELYRVLRARGVPARLLWYPEGGHALAGVETEASVFKNCAHWLLQHLGQPRREGTGWQSP
ncbi:hypothetical protein DUI87_23473 [Hirundo rustica rustica]|uniref:acylaminoacyl-peptidase n=1 Tax=Hirundo rustica rustica TaxID=333673 RepID=A0A3M0JGS0_HIRRU|nr:hypothetical protein DUI87_23473 [Hirundo rustica rustica]